MIKAQSSWVQETQRSRSDMERNGLMHEAVRV